MQGTGNGEAEQGGKRAGRELWKMPPASSLGLWVRQSMWNKPRCFLVQGFRAAGWDGGLVDGDRGLGTGEGGAPGWPSSFSSDVPLVAVKQNS